MAKYAGKRLKNEERRGKIPAKRENFSCGGETEQARDRTSGPASAKRVT
jgi:hypothetical protein